VALAVAPSADAHAVLVAVVPASDAVVQSPPRQILLRFHGTVEAAPGAVELHDTSGRGLALGAIARPAADAVEAPIGRRLPHGTYTVVWHLLSSGHPVEGSSSFGVGAPGLRPSSRSLALLVGFGAAGALALVLGVAAGQTRRRAVLASAAALVLGLPAAGYAVEARHVPTRPSAIGYFTTAVRLGPFGLELGVSPDAPGTNTIDLQVSDAAGRPVELTDVSVTAAHVRSRPVRFRAERLAPGHFVVDVARLPAPGVWHVRIAARRGSRRFERTISLPVGS
jgi:methionine-rich copper-binding protein CopC